LKVSTVRQDLTSDGSEFQVYGAATEKDRRANSVRVFGTISSGASDDRRGRTGTAVWIRSFKYAGVEEDIGNVRGVHLINGNGEIMILIKLIGKLFVDFLPLNAFVLSRV